MFGEIVGAVGDRELVMGKIDRDAHARSRRCSGADRRRRSKDPTPQYHAGLPRMVGRGWHCAACYRPSPLPARGHNSAVAGRIILRRNANVKHPGCARVALRGAACQLARGGSGSIFPRGAELRASRRVPRVHGFVATGAVVERGDSRFGEESEGEVVLGENFPVIALKRGVQSDYPRDWYPGIWQVQS